MSVVLLVQVVRVRQGCASKQFKNHSFPGVAQLVARLLWEQEVARSNRVTRTIRTENRLFSAVFRLLLFSIFDADDPQSFSDLWAKK